MKEINQNGRLNSIPDDEIAQTRKQKPRKVVLPTTVQEAQQSRLLGFFKKIWRDENFPFSVASLLACFVNFFALPLLDC